MEHLEQIPTVSVAFVQTTFVSREGQSRAKAMSREGQGKAKAWSRRGQGKDKERSRQHKHNLSTVATI